MSSKIAVLAGDGIGVEIIAEAIKTIQCLQQDFGLNAELEYAAIGGAGYDQYGKPLPEETLAVCRQADAILFGAIGGPEDEGDALGAFFGTGYRGDEGVELFLHPRSNDRFFIEKVVLFREVLF